MNGNNLLLTTTNARWFQLFRYKNSFIVNERGKVVEVQGNVDSEGRNIVVGKKHNNRNQKWDVVYVKEMPAELKKGDMNTEFGLKVDSDFHIVTKMQSGRYVDLIGNKLVLKTSNSFSSQKWYFDNKTKTIRSRRTTSYSIEISNSGKSSSLRIYTTNSNWW
jgi:hypothetical protein